MAEHSQIGWTEGTWNPWHGCTPVSAGCDNCYMMRDKERYGQDGTVVRRSKSTFNDPIAWKAPKMIFTCSWSDFFHEAADPWRQGAWDIINATPHHRYQILTKRPQRILECLPKDRKVFPNVWLGVSVENTKAIRRIAYFDRLERAHGYAFPVRFVSFEPLLERLDIDVLSRQYFESPYEWAIIGGESGNPSGRWAYRECDAQWLQELCDFHFNLGVKVFVKQTGTAIAKKYQLKTPHGTDLRNLPAHLSRINRQEMPADYMTWKYGH